MKPVLRVHRESGRGFCIFSDKSVNETVLFAIGFAILTHFARKLSSHTKGLSDCIMTLTLDLDHNISPTLISCYAASMNSTVQEKDDLYNRFRNIISHVQHRDYHSSMLGWVTIIMMLCWIIIVLDAWTSMAFCFHRVKSCIYQYLLSAAKLPQNIMDASSIWYLMNYVITKKRDVRDISILGSFYNTWCLSDHDLVCEMAPFRPAYKRLQKTSVRINTLVLKSPEYNVISASSWTLSMTSRLLTISNYHRK